MQWLTFFEGWRHGSGGGEGGGIFSCFSPPPKKKKKTLCNLRKKFSRKITFISNSMPSCLLLHIWSVLAVNGRLRGISNQSWPPLRCAPFNCRHITAITCLNSFTRTQPHLNTHTHTHTHIPPSLPDPIFPLSCGLRPRQNFGGSRCSQEERFLHLDHQSNDNNDNNNNNNNNRSFQTPILASSKRFTINKK